ncbi:hypothetical protein MMB17_15330 [Methylobacterium organophilum]|uniref:hypothetical protein n=1 Tax=Methylobacterium organophilum TaxID=410 RepID=UPI001F12B9CF|nr:hypothetical protein [Methylobacterium organophilum]UMY16089.1 hypothetical protein MMB17_15330 [Methylobacterium organophilum]
MTDPSPSSALLVARAPFLAQRAGQQALIWIGAVLSVSVTIVAVAYAIALRSDREAGRMIIASQNGSGYARIVVNGLALRQAQPLP